MKFTLAAFTVLSCLVAAGFAATNKCKFTEFGKSKSLQTGQQQLVEWQCKGAGKTDLVYIELGTGKSPSDYSYVDTINGNAKASSKRFSFILKDEYPSGDYISRMLTLTAKEKMPVEQAERDALPWTYSTAFTVENDKIPAADDNSSTSDGGNDDNNPSSSRKSGNDSNNISSSDSNSTDNSDGPFNIGATNVVGSTVLFCAGVLALFLGI